MTLWQNQQVLDAATHYKVARDGRDWFVVVPNGEPTPVGTIIGFTYPNQTGWIGFFIVHADYRLQRLGATLFSAAMAAYKESGTQYIGLDAVNEQVETYKRRGFVETGRIKLFMRRSPRVAPVQAVSVNIEEDQVRLLDIRDVNTTDLARLDLAHTGLDRLALWTEGLMHRPDVCGYALQSAASKEMEGFILVRKCEKGYRFGPLLANSVDQATLLLEKAMTHRSCQPSETDTFVAEVFAPNAASTQPFTRLGWEPSNVEFHRMWFEGRQPKEQADGGRGTKGMYAGFDAGEG